MDSRERMVGDIAKYSLSSVKQCKRLFRLVEHYKPKHILELGSSLGIATSYMAKANNASKVVSIEGDPKVADLASKTYQQLGAENVELIVGSFKDKLPQVLQDLESIDLAFIDGHHTYEATLAYAQVVHPYINDGGILVFDDINWSSGMRKAWSEVKQLPGVTLSVDLFDQGFLFFDPNIVHKQEIKFIKYKYKPWQIGLFQ